MLIEFPAIGNYIGYWQDSLLHSPLHAYSEIMFFSSLARAASKTLSSPVGLEALYAQLEKRTLLGNRYLHEASRWCTWMDKPGCSTNSSINTAEAWTACGIQRCPQVLCTAPLASLLTNGIREHLD